jgi:hypothetical protein
VRPLVAGLRAQRRPPALHAQPVGALLGRVVVNVFVLALVPVLVRALGRARVLVLVCLRLVLAHRFDYGRRPARVH